MSGQGYTVTVDTLYKEAGTWNDEGYKLSTIKADVMPLRMGGVPAGLFEPLASSIDALVRAVADRAAEGCDEMYRIAGALRMTANGYETHESATAQSFNTLHG